MGIDIKEKRDTVVMNVRSNALSFPNLLDRDGQVSTLYGVTSTPAKFLIDTDGFLVGMALGYRDWNKEEMRSLLMLLMNAG